MFNPQETGIKHLFHQDGKELLTAWICRSYFFLSFFLYLYRCLHLTDSRHHLHYIFLHRVLDLWGWTSQRTVHPMPHDRRGLRTIHSYDVRVRNNLNFIVHEQHRLIRMSKIRAHHSTGQDLQGCWWPLPHILWALRSSSVLVKHNIGKGFIGQCTNSTSCHSR